LRGNKICETKYGITLDWPYHGDRSIGPHYLALDSETAERKSLATIITLHKFFIDRFSPFVNNRFVKHVQYGDKDGSSSGERSKQAFTWRSLLKANHRVYFLAKRSMALNPRRVRCCNTAEPGYPSFDARLFFRRRDLCSFAATEGLW
jgi:hypothetical protein